MRREVLELAGDVILVGFGAWMLFIFLEILFKGSHYVGEPRAIVLGLELVITVIIILLGLERFYDDLEQEKATRAKS